MHTHNIGYLAESLAIILKDETRSDIAQIQKYLCCLLLVRFDDIQRDYKSLKSYQNLENVAAFLASVFCVEKDTMQEILDKLSAYKNLNNDCIGACLGVRL